MTSEERRERRYQRRQENRKANRRKVLESIGSAEEVFCYSDMFRMGQECTKGVMWKQSAQTFKRHLFSRTAVNRRKALGRYKPRQLKKFTICERGKTRAIEAPHIDDRQIQKVLTRKVLLPMYLPRMIHDNGASLKGKGLQFSQAMLNKQLKDHERKYGLNGWIIIADFSGFFPNADRAVIKSRHREVRDPQLRHLLDLNVDIGSGNRGVPLGVENSQLEMIALPSPLDSYVACQMGLVIGHYMDDYHILVPPDVDPEKVRDEFIKKAAELGIVMRPEKAKIIPFGKPFKFCKIKRIRADSGKIIKRGCPDSVKRCRRKIRSFANMDMSWEDVYTSMNASMAYLDRYNNHAAKLRLMRLFYSLYGFDCTDLNEFRRRDADGIHLSQAVQKNRCQRGRI